MRGIVSLLAFSGHAQSNIFANSHLLKLIQMYEMLRSSLAPPAPSLPVLPGYLPLSGPTWPCLACPSSCRIWASRTRLRICGPSPPPRATSTRPSSGSSVASSALGQNRRVPADRGNWLRLIAGKASKAGSSGKAEHGLGWARPSPAQSTGAVLCKDRRRRAACHLCSMMPCTVRRQRQSLCA